MEWAQMESLELKKARETLLDPSLVHLNWTLTIRAFWVDKAPKGSNRAQKE